METTATQYYTLNLIFMQVDAIEEEMIDTAIQRSLQESRQVGTHR